MKKLSKILVLILIPILFLSSCSGENIDKGMDIDSYIQAPKSTACPLRGVWKVIAVKDLKEEKTNLPTFQKGDELYIDPTLVAIGDFATVNPKFSSKYVSLSSYLSSHLIPRGKIPIDMENVSIYMVRDNDLFSVDLISEDPDHIMFIFESRVYSLEKEKDQVPQEILDHYRNFIQGEKREEIVEKKEKLSSTLIGIREEGIGDDGYPISYYSTYLLYEDPNNANDVHVYKINRLFVPGVDNDYNILDYIPENTDQDTGIRGGEFVFYDALDFEKKRTVRLKDKEGREIIFISPEFVSFSKIDMANSREAPKKFEIQRTSQLDENHPLTIDELVMDSSKENIQEQIQEQLSILDPQGKIDTRNLPQEKTNLGIIRQTTGWTFITSRYWRSGDQYLPAYINLSLVPKVELFNNSKEPYSWSRIKNKYSLAETASQSPDADRLLVFTDNEIHYTRLLGEEIAAKADLSIQLRPGADLIMVSYFSDEKAQQLAKIFLKQNLAQPQVIYNN